MKSIVMPIPDDFGTVQLSKETSTQLTQEVKETLATTANTQNETKFTATDMWNRNRKSRSASDMMRRWNLN